jgi:type IV pilus assembly protein PilC
MGKAQIKKKGIKIQSLKKCWNIPFTSSQSIQPSDISKFTRQLAILLKAGIPIRKSLDILANSYEKIAVQ